MKYIITESQLNTILRRTYLIDEMVEYNLSQNVNSYNWVNPCRKYDSWLKHYKEIVRSIKNDMYIEFIDNDKVSGWNQIDEFIESYIQDKWMEQIKNNYNRWCKDLKK